MGHTAHRVDVLTSVYSNISPTLELLREKFNLSQNVSENYKLINK